LADREEQGQIGWLAEVPRLLVACLVDFAELVNDLFGEANATESAGRDRVARVRINRTASRAVTILPVSPDRAVGTIVVALISPLPRVRLLLAQPALIDQCSLMRGSVRRVIMFARVSSAIFEVPCSACWCILYNERYMSRAKTPSR